MYDMKSSLKQMTMAEGGGGGAAARWIASAVLPRFAPGAASPLKSLPDASLLEEGSLLFSTDSFVVSPREFPGGNIGKLAVCGTVNDLAVSGGIPKYLSLALIVEEGFDCAELDRILDAVKETADACGVVIATGDTAKAAAVRLREAGAAAVTVVTAVDRMEKSSGASTMATRELERNCGIRVCAVVTAADILRAVETGVIGGAEHLPALQAHLQTYGGTGTGEKVYVPCL